ncbi:MAG: quinone oxidoreductase [Chloroflexi bacterium]|nr:quinone oxidoreductase [Chloroflexota bacterium]
MKAIRVHEQGDESVLRYEDIAVPEPTPGTVRVKIAAAGLNFIDIYQRSGQYKLPLPFTPGQEAAGVIDAVGEGVSGFKVGDAVAYAFVLGAYAEYAIVPVEKLVHVPPDLSSQIAAAALLQGMTAHYLVHSTFALQAGQTALIHAAAGGTGALLVQMAKRCGATVIGTVSNEEKAQIARAAGADAVILYTQQDFEAEVKRLTDGRGVHVIYDSVGKDTFEKGLNCLRPRGYMVLFGQASGAVAPLEPQILNAKGSLFLTRPSLGHYLATRAELEWRAGDVLGWAAAGTLRVNIDKVFPLQNAGEAQRYMSGRGTKGKVLLTP